MRQTNKYAFTIVDFSEDCGTPKFLVAKDLDSSGWTFPGGVLSSGSPSVSDTSVGVAILDALLQDFVSVAPSETGPELRKELSQVVLLGETPYVVPCRLRQPAPSRGYIEANAHVTFFYLHVTSQETPVLHGVLCKLANSVWNQKTETILSRVRLVSVAHLIDIAWSDSRNVFLRSAFKKLPKIFARPLETQNLPAHEFNAPFIEMELQKRFERMLPRLLGAETSIDIQLIPPLASQANQDVKRNHTIEAEVQIRWSEHDDVASFRFPCPVHGVFAFRSQNKKDAEKWTWRPRLVPRLGFWSIRKIRYTRNTDYIAEQKVSKVARLGLPGGKHIDVLSDNESDAIRETAITRAFKAMPRVTILPDLDSVYLPDDLKSIIRELSPCVLIEREYNADGTPEVQLAADDSNEARKFLNALLVSAQDYDSESAYDEQDREYQRLYTYSAFMLERVYQVAMERLVDNSRQWITQLRSAGQGGPAERAWLALCVKTPTVTFGELADEGYLLWFDPRNAVEAASQLTVFSRYAVHGEAIKRQPPVLRQNHDSYAGFFCPSETPDSTGVGLTLHLAKGVTCSVDGNLYTPTLGDKAALGYSAGLVPFYHHDDGARAMMGAKNIKQAVPVRNASRPIVKTGTEDAPFDLVKPLVDIEWLPDTPMFASPGVDLLVAYMPWFGWNCEDGIVAHERLREERILEYEEVLDGFISVRPGFKPKLPVFTDNWTRYLVEFNFEKTGLLRKGTPVFADSIIGYFEDQDKAISELYLNVDPGVVGILEDIEYVRPPSPMMGGVLKWRIQRRFPLSIGDKLMGRHGNKGVIARFFGEKDLPRLPEDARLGRFSGKAVDLVLNPHGVISRMNIGQLIETQIAFVKELNTGISYPDNMGAAFAPGHAKFLKDTYASMWNMGNRPLRMDEFGRTFLILPDKRQTESPILVGIQHFYRLDHKPVGKAAAHKGPDAHFAMTDKMKIERDLHKKWRRGEAYSLVTGQPVNSGEPGDRPQRIGEMEMWAFAAHQARNIVDAILARKSSPQDPSNAPGSGNGSALEAIRAHFLAIGVNLFKTEQGYGFDWLNYDKFVAKSVEATNPDTWQWVTDADHVCPDCDYRIENMPATGKVQRDHVCHLTVGDVLRHAGLEPASLQTPPELTELRFDPADPSRNEVEGDLSFSLQYKPTDRQTLRFKLTRTLKTVSAEFSIGPNRYVAFTQSVKDVFKLHAVLRLFISCENHKHKRLVPLSGNRKIRAVPGGLVDSNLFGPADPQYRVVDPELKGWGHIRLPFAMPHPLWGKDAPQINVLPVIPLRFRFPYPNGRQPGEDIRENLTKLYARVIEAKKAYERATSDRLEIAAGRLKRAVRNLFTELQDRLVPKQGLIRRHGLGRRIHFSGRFVIVPDPNLGWDECGVPLLALLTWLEDELASDLAPLLAQPGLMQDIQPSFGQDQVAIGKIRRILHKVWASGSVEGLDALEKKALASATEVVGNYLKRTENKHLRVILNRQPTLHRYNIQAFRPTILPPESGLVFSINPLICSGFNADFDGDTMAVHFLTDPKECEDAKEMMPTHPRNLLSVASGSPVASFDQDMVLGTFLLSMNAKRRTAFLNQFTRHSVADVVGGQPCEACMAILDPRPPFEQDAAKTPIWIDPQSKRMWSKSTGLLWGKSIGLAFLEHLCKEHPADAVAVVSGWAHLAFEEVTVRGVSFGFSELAAIAQTLEAEVSKVLSAVSLIGTERGTAVLSTASATEQLDQLALERLLRIIESGNVAEPGYGFAAMAVSGARGKGQVRQIVAARGLLSPGDIGFSQSPDGPSPFFIRGSLASGMTAEETFYAAMNSRSSMIDKKFMTPRAGYLTRRLVLACWPWYVKDGHCGTKNGTPASCLWGKRQRICAACYGQFPGISSMKDLPAGIIAAQSFGERGTQLSMRSFHTGTREISIDGVIAMLDGKDHLQDPHAKARNIKNWFEDATDAPAFVKRVREQSAYASLDSRHLYLIWRVIHQSEKKTLTSAWESQCGPLSGLAGGRVMAFILDKIKKRTVCEDSSPMARLLRNESFVP